MIMQWYDPPYIRLVEVISSSSSRVREGSLAYIIPYSGQNCELESLLIVLRNGKRGKNVLIPTEVVSPFIDFNHNFSDDQRKLLSNEVLKAEYLISRINGSPSITVKQVELPDRDMLKCDIWLFIGFLTALSCRLTMRVKNTSPFVITHKSKTMHRSAVRRDPRWVELNKFKELDPDAIGGFILRQLMYDGRAKDTQFRDMLTNLFRSSIMRQEFLYKVLKWYVKFSKQIRAVDNRILVTSHILAIDRILEILRYYAKNSKELECIKQGKEARTYFMFERAKRDKAKDKEEQQVLKDNFQKRVWSRVANRYEKVNEMPAVEEIEKIVEEPLKPLEELDFREQNDMQVEQGVEFYNALFNVLREKFGRNIKLSIHDNQLTVEGENINEGEISETVNNFLNNHR